MKTEKNSTVPVTVLFSFAGLISLALVVFRMHQYLSLLDPQTGFWTGSDWTKTLLLPIIIFTAVLALLVAVIFRKKLPAPRFPVEQNATLGFFGLLLSAGFLWDVWQSFSNARVSFYDLNNVIYTGSTAFSYLLSSGLLAEGLEALFALCSAVYFAIYGVSLFQGKAHYQKRKLLALSPVFWGICRLLRHFVEPISYRNVSQLWLELLMLGAGIIFYLSFARLASSVEEEDSMWILLFSGTLSAVLAYAASATPFLLTVSLHGDLLPSDRPMQYVDLAFALFVTALLIHLFLGEREEPEEEASFEDLYRSGTMPAPPILFTDEPDTPVKPSAAAGDKTIPTDRLTVKNRNPSERVLKPKE